MEQQITREDVLKLIDEKNEIEKNIQELKQILDQNSVGMNEDLVDADGFPRQDIDVYQVRHARHKIICYQNDHKELMIKIENGLHVLHAQTGQTSPSTSFQTVPRSPIAKVNFVEAESPASLAGLQIEDLILEFGSVNDTNFNSLQDIGNLVKHSENRKIRVKVKRKDEELSLGLTPREWRGKGLLGCNIVPMEAVDR